MRHWRHVRAGHILALTKHRPTFRPKSYGCDGSSSTAVTMPGPKPSPITSSAKSTGCPRVDSRPHSGCGVAAWHFARTAQGNAADGSRAAAATSQPLGAGNGQLAPQLPCGANRAVCVVLLPHTRTAQQRRSSGEFPVGVNRHRNAAATRSRRAGTKLQAVGS